MSRVNKKQDEEYVETSEDIKEVEDTDTNEDDFSEKKKKLKIDDDIIDKIKPKDISDLPGIGATSAEKLRAA